MQETVINNKTSSAFGIALNKKHKIGKKIIDVNVIPVLKVYSKENRKNDIGYGEFGTAAVTVRRQFHFRPESYGRRGK